MAGKVNIMAEIPEELNISVGEVIKVWREFRDLSVTELAENTGLTKGYISQLEHNKIKRPNDHHLAKLAGALEIEVWDIIARRMPTGADATKDTAKSGVQDPKGNLPDNSPPFGSGAFYYPQNDQLDQSEEEALIDDLHRLLHTPDLTDEQRAESVELISSFLSWLEFRLRGVR